jgi:ribosomal protein L11 methyltransferase
VSADPPARAALEAAIGMPLAGWAEDEVAADWRARRERFGGGAFLVGGRLLVRSPWDPPAPGGVIDVVIEPGCGGFGSGAHATTRMCLALLLQLEPAGGAADLGCGLGTLAIAAARLGWAPVAGVDRMEGAVDATRANAARNGVDVDLRVADLTAGPLQLAPLLLVNAPPPVHERVRAALRARDAAARPAAGSSPSAGSSRAASSAAGSSAAAGSSSAAARRIIASGLVPAELAAAVRAYEAAGFGVSARLDEDGWAAVLLERGGG